MDIVSRLKSFLQQSGIANSQFADNCDIPRPTLSQLLNGRNKKVSDEVIGKIHRAYPHLNIMWLMFGDGDMFVPNANSGDAAAFSQPSESAAADGYPDTLPGTKSRGGTINFGDDGVSNYPQRQPAVQSRGNTANAVTEALQRMARMTPKQQTPRQTGEVPADERRVVSIMVLYSDGRFETFTPQ